MSDTAEPSQQLIHLDALGGIAGDMFVASLLDARPDLVEAVIRDVMAVLPPDVGLPVLTPGQSGGIAALRFGLQAPKIAKPDRGTASHHHGTTYASLRDRLDSPALSEGAAREARAILRLLAEAEAAVHNMPLDQVHFHEVGDWDSLVDVVAAGSLIARLAPAVWTVSEVPRGAGTVRTQHGLLPVPAPATLRLLVGFRWRDDGVPGERVTPTGAAILRHLLGAAPEVAAAAGRLVALGTGAGTRDLPGMPNILRVTIYEDAVAATAESVEVLTFDIDDMTGEEIAIAAVRLRDETGVIDLGLLTLTGKKSRPAVRFELLIRPDALDRVARAVFLQTATLGLRHRHERRKILPRELVTRAGLAGKSVRRPDGSTTTKIESDALTRFATLRERRAAGECGDD
jgi:uncharacterized protein (TIGR00299 family) protein